LPVCIRFVCFNIYIAREQPRGLLSLFIVVHGDPLGEMPKSSRKREKEEKEEEENDDYDDYDDEEDQTDNPDDQDRSGSESDQDQEEEEEEEEERHENKGRRKPSNDTNVPLFQRLNALESSRVEMASSTRSGNNSARKKMKLERKALRESSSSSGSDGDGQPRKKSKNAPAELKSNRPVRRLRVDPNAAPPKHSDPRFSDLNGKLSYNKFYAGYQFLDGYQEDEINKMQRVNKKIKSVSTKEMLRTEINKSKQEMLERRRALKLQERLQAMRSEERAKVAQGKNPFFLKESAKRELALEARFEELKTAGSGKLKKFIEKRRMKNAKKDIRGLPGSRTEEE